MARAISSASKMGMEPTSIHRNTVRVLTFAQSAKSVTEMQPVRTSPLSLRLASQWTQSPFSP